MNKIGLLILAFCLLLASVNVNVMAGEAPVSDGIKVSATTDGNKVMLNFEGNTVERVHVSLYDSAGTLLDAKDLKQSEKRIEFDELEKGTYWLSIKKQQKVSLERVTIF